VQPFVAEEPDNEGDSEAPLPYVLLLPLSRRGETMRGDMGDFAEVIRDFLVDEFRGLDADEDAALEIGIFVW